MQPQFKQPSTVGHYASHLDEWREAGWLFIRADAPIQLDTPCFLQDWDERQLSPDEQDQLDANIPRLGYREFFEWGQLSMIVGNLQQQKSDFTPEELEKAIRFYWERDAYIDLECS